MRNALLGMVDGVSAGLAASVPMTAAMLLIQQHLPPESREPQEPQQITDELLRRLGILSRLSLQQRFAATLAAHLGYGGTTGAAYSVVAPWIPVPRRVRGLTYGLAVWAAGYAGWLPALRILPPPQDRPAGRNCLLVASHLVWGATLELASRSSDCDSQAE